MSKTIEIFAGPNGSGKTTFADIILRGRKNVLFFNSDKIANGLTTEANDTIQFEAGRFMLEAIGNAMAKGESFSFETTFSGKLWKSYLSQAKEDGYKITIYFVFVKSIQLSIARIKERVKSGGHHVEEEIVKRRFARTFQNMINLYMPLANEWYVVDNSLNAPAIIAFNTEGVTEILDNELYNHLFK